MKNTDKLCTERETYGMQLLSHDLIHGELQLEFSLYRITLGGSEFYLAVSSDIGTEMRQERQIAAEVIGREERCVKHLYQKLIEGSVPPSTLHEIVFDSLTEADLLSVG